MADKSRQLVLAALSRAAAAAAPPHGGKAHPGLFPATAAGKLAAQRCLDEGYLRPLDEPAGPELTSDTPAATATATRRKAAAARRWAITDKGLSYLLSQVSPRPVLEDLVRVLESRQGQAAELLDLARQTRATAEKVLGHVRAAEAAAPAHAGGLNGLFHEFRAAPDGADAALLAELARWPTAGAAEDCPLPELFRRLRASAPGLTVGQFHDALRRLHDAGRLYLHPWTGPLYDVPEPACALLVGHVIAYYASAREG